MEKVYANHWRRPSREDYLRAYPFLKMLRRSSLTPQQKATLRGQALHGDLSGAWAGYGRLTSVRGEQT